MSKNCKGYVTQNKLSFICVKNCILQNKFENVANLIQKVILQNKFFLSSQELQFLKNFYQVQRTFFLLEQEWHVITQSTLENNIAILFLILPFSLKKVKLPFFPSITCLPSGTCTQTMAWRSSVQSPAKEVIYLSKPSVSKESYSAEA